MKNSTTINIKKEVRDALKQKRIYPRETYDDVINRLIKKHKNKIQRDIP